MSQFPKQVSFELQEDPDFKGQTRSDTIRYGPTVNNAGFPMTYAIAHIVHGRWGETAPAIKDRVSQAVYATLIVIRFELSRLTASSDRRFVQFHPRLRLEANPLGDPKDDPWVVQFEPAGKGRRYITESQSNVSHAKEVVVSTTFNAAPPPFNAGGGVNYTDTRTEDSVKIKRYEITSGGKVSEARGGGRQGRDEIWWTLNEEEGKGVGDRLQVAVLIRRENTRKFNVELELKARIDTAHSLATIFHSKNKFTEPFDPGEPNQNVPNGVVPDKLSHIETDGTLDRLAYEHSSEKWDSIKLYPEGKFRRVC